MPEIVDAGETGYLVAGVEEAVGAVERAVVLDRASCRQVAERRFSAARMVDDYIRVYDAVLAST
jgi:glycosyltransferase involved in cell wall biosynthesis